MEVRQYKLIQETGWSPPLPPAGEARAQLVLAFGSGAFLRDHVLMAEVRRTFASARLIGCSTAGEIHGTQVSDNSLVLTVVQFEHTRLRDAWTELTSEEESFSAGAALAEILPASLETEPGQFDPLGHVLVLSAGLRVNGSDLVRGLTSRLPAQVTVTGGLAGDGERFHETLVANRDRISPHGVAAVGFYGSRFRVGFGSLGGWDPFGPERLITRAQGNVLYELDGMSALELYRRYLGDHAAGLPATGLLFPLSVRPRTGGSAVVRTILGMDEATQSLTFAGNMQNGAYARLMKANFDRLIDGAAGAATTCHRTMGTLRPGLAILISCVGRKLVLRQRVEEEVEGVREVLGPDTMLAGFYSYGEISPFTPEARCELHNQTMTITVLAEESVA